MVKQNVYLSGEWSASTVESKRCSQGKQMEQNTQALEVTCQHFKATYSDETIRNLRKRLAKAYRRNSILNNTLVKTQGQIISMKLLHVFLLGRWREFVQDLTALNARIGLP